MTDRQREIRARLAELAASPDPADLAEIQRLRGEYRRIQQETDVRDSMRRQRVREVDPEAEALASWPLELRRRGGSPWGQIVAPGCNPQHYIAGR